MYLFAFKKDSNPFSPSTTRTLKSPFQSMYLQMRLSIKTSSIFLGLLTTITPAIAGNSCCSTNSFGAVTGGTSFTSSCCRVIGGTTGVQNGGEVVSTSFFHYSPLFFLLTFLYSAMAEMVKIS